MSKADGFWWVRIEPGPWCVVEVREGRIHWPGESGGRKPSFAVQWGTFLGACPTAPAASAPITDEVERGLSAMLALVGCRQPPTDSDGLAHLIVVPTAPRCDCGEPARVLYVEPMAHSWNCDACARRRFGVEYVDAAYSIASRGPAGEPDG